MGHFHSAETKKEQSYTRHLSHFLKTKERTMASDLNGFPLAGSNLAETVSNGTPKCSDSNDLFTKKSMSSNINSFGHGYTEEEEGSGCEVELLSADDSDDESDVESLGYTQPLPAEDLLLRKNAQKLIKTPPPCTQPSKKCRSTVSFDSYYITYVVLF